MQAPNVFCGEPMALDKATQQQIESYLHEACGEYGHMVVMQALGLAAAQPGQAQVTANIREETAELTIKTDCPALAVQGDGLNWSMLGALMRRGVVRVRQHWHGTTIHVRVRLFSPAPM